MVEDNVASHYKGTQGEQYFGGINQDSLNHLGYKLQSKFFLPYLQRSMHILDFGCGNGSLAKAIAPYVASVEGVEVNESPRNLAIIEQRLTVYPDLESIPDGKTYDAVISNHVLEHVPNVIGALGSIYQRLKAGGIFVTMLPIEDWRSKTNRNWNPNDQNHHLHTWTPLLFGNTLVEANFEPRKLDVIPHAWTPRLFFLGEGVLQNIACNLLSRHLKRRQLFALAGRR